MQPSSGTAIVTITQIQPISVVFTLPQKDVPRVQAAMTQAAMTQAAGAQAAGAKGTLTTIAYAEDDRTRLGEGTLLLVDNTISQKLRDGAAQGDPSACGIGRCGRARLSMCSLLSACGRVASPCR